MSPKPDPKFVENSEPFDPQMKDFVQALVFGNQLAAVKQNSPKWGQTSSTFLLDPPIKKAGMKIELENALKTMIKEPKMKKFTPVGRASRLPRNEKLSF